MSEFDTDLNYEEDTKVDKENLHKEWARHSSLVHDYGKHYNNVLKICEKRHEKVKTVRSELIRDANKDPMKCCLKAKPTAGDIEAYYRTHKNYKEAKEKWLEAQHELNMVEIAKNSIVYTKTKSLDELGDLWKKEYYTIVGLPKSFEGPVNKQGMGIKRKNKKEN